MAVEKNDKDDLTLELETPSASKKLLQNKKLLAAFSVLAILLIVGLFFLISSLTSDSSKTSSDTESHEVAESSDLQADAFYDMDEMVVNLLAQGSKKHYLRISMSMRFTSNNNREAITKNMPAIQDAVFIFLKELRASDFSSSGSTLLMKEELTKRINKVIYPAEVKEVLFKEILID